MARSKKSRKKIPKENRKSLRLWAEGARESVLAPHIETYADALDRGTNRRSEREALKSICNEFHARISWRLADHEEPDLPLPDYDPTKIVEQEELSEEDETEKRARIAVLNVRIRRWLKYRVRRLRKQSQRKLDPTKDPWSVFLAKLSGVSVPPKARQAYQQFMHEEYEEKVAPVVIDRWASTAPSGSSVQTAKGPDGPFRAKIAREVFGALSESERQEYGRRAKDAAAQARAEFEKIMNEPPSQRPEDKQKCIESVGAFLGPVLQGIHDRTGMHSTVVLGGPVPKFGGELRSIYVSYGRNKSANPVHFPAWAGDRFNGYLELMKEYLGTAFTAEDIDASRLQDQLGQAKYTIPPHDDSDTDGLDSDSESSDSDSELSSSDDSDSNVESDDSDSPKARRRAKKKRAAEKKAAKKAKKAARKAEKKKNAEKDAEKDKDGARVKKKGRKDAGAPDVAAPSGRKRAKPTTAPPAASAEDEEYAPSSSSSTRKRGDEPASRKSRRRLDEGAAPMDVDPEPTPASPPPPPPPSQPHAAPLPSSQPQRTPTPPPSSQPQRTPTPPPTIPVEFPPNAPEWLVNSLTWLMKEDLGCHYRAMVVALIALETKYGFGDPSNNGTLSAKKRPTQVGLWIQGGRGTRLKFPPSIGNVEKYAKEWAEWWGTLQPRWREKDEHEEWKLEGHDTAGDNWDPLEAPGQNGCLSVVASLYFWGVCSNQSDELRQRWERAVLDVTWMLEGLRASIA
ncbi:hypothetical protein DFH06DRAFT_1146232 [Mycena polygramma]|nr:hypothetical protein DFH06DRAFT_1146232 [Mycena polygramma]